MDCVGLQNSLAVAEDGSTAEQRAHLRTCASCSALVEELNLIVAAAGDLRAADEPNPRVWNSIEIALRQEGLIRPGSSPIHWFPNFQQWTMTRWLVPAAAMLLVAVGIYTRQFLNSKPNVNVVAEGLAASYSELNDADLLQEIADNSPETKTQFVENLRQVNDSIRDAQNLLAQSPNDLEARRWLMDAYQQKSMLFELAMEQSPR